MSVVTMVRLASQVEANDAVGTLAGPRRHLPDVGAPDDEANDRPAIGDVGVTPESNATSSVTTALETLAAFIPSEALATYIVGLSWFSPASRAEGWGLLLVGGLSVVCFSVVAGLDRTARPSPRKMATVVSLALVSFVVYAGALPESPFQELTDEATKLFGFAALILALLLPRIARILRVAPERK